MQVKIKTGETVIQAKSKYKKEHYEIITREFVLNLTYTVVGNKVTAN